MLREPVTAPRDLQPWPPLRAVTLDLWGTIIDPRDLPGKIERRRELLIAAICGAGHACSMDQLRGAFRAAQNVIDDAIACDRRDVGPPGRWQELMRQLGFPPESVPFEGVVHAYEDLTLEFLPPLLDGVAEAVERLAGRYSLGLICNTGYTGGTVLRQVLERHGLARHCRVLTFSNEFGWLKPDPKIFYHTLEQLGAPPERALHVADMEDLDIDGARSAGMVSARYLPGGSDNGVIASAADLVFSDWAAFCDLIDARQAPDPEQ